MNVSCPNCGATVGEQIGGKVAVGLTAALAGSRISPEVAALAGIIGALIGHYYIDASIRSCPQCRTVLRIIDDLPI